MNRAGGEVRNVHLNIGTGREVSIRGLAELIGATVGFGGRLRFNADRPDGTMRKLTDPGRLRGLGWRHRVELEEGVRRMYGWYVGGDQDEPRVWKSSLGGLRRWLGVRGGFWVFPIFLGYDMYISI